MLSTDDVLTIDEATQILKVSKKTLYKLVKSRELPAVKVGRDWRILRTSIEDYLTGNQETNYGFE